MRRDSHGEGEREGILVPAAPFVPVRQVDGKHRTLDLRRYRLARVAERFGRKAFKRFRSDRSGELAL